MKASVYTKMLVAYHRPEVEVLSLTSFGENIVIRLLHVVEKAFAHNLYFLKSSQPLIQCIYYRCIVLTYQHDQSQE